jgi:hypothetical protein
MRFSLCSHCAEPIEGKAIHEKRRRANLEKFPGNRLGDFYFFGVALCLALRFFVTPHIDGS